MIGSRRAIAALGRQAAATSTCRIRPVVHVTDRRPFASLSKIHEPLYPVVPADNFGQYEEYSVIFTNRSLNLMSDPFQTVMRDLNNCLKTTYNADKVAIIPGSGTFGMEAVMRQFARDEHAMVIRNGWFSFRWTEIADMGGVNGIPKSHTVLKAKPVTAEGAGDHTQYAPYPIGDVVQKIYDGVLPSCSPRTSKPPRA